VAVDPTYGVKIQNPVKCLMFLCTNAERNRRSQRWKYYSQLVLTLLLEVPNVATKMRGITLSNSSNFLTSFCVFTAPGNHILQVRCRAAIPEIRLTRKVINLDLKDRSLSEEKLAREQEK
jgi:hypothetical protein